MDPDLSAGPPDAPGPTPAADLADRLARLQARLAAGGELEAVIILQPADLFYFTGTVQDAWLIVPAAGSPLLLVRRSLARARAESPLSVILPLGTPREIPGLLAAHGLGRPRRLGLEFDVLPVELYALVGRLFPTTALADASRLIRELRMVKSAHEVAQIRRAAAIQARVVERVGAVLAPGLTEIAVAAEAEAEARRHGHQGLLRVRRFTQQFTSVALLGGESGSTPAWLDSATGGPGLSSALPAGSGLRRLRSHEPILMDSVTVWGGYHADQTRCFCLGEPPAEVREAHQACLEIREAVLPCLQAGALASEVFERAAATAARLGYGDRFMQTGAAQVSFVGHGVGLELDEIPVLGRGSRTRLEAGMTLAVEPKIVLPGLGSVGVEDTFLVTEGGPEALTEAPRELLII